jgi:putative addiction module antidote
MSDSARIRRFGGSLGIILPRGVAEALRVRENDHIYLTPTPDGYRITSFDPEFGAALDDAREFMRTHRNAFRELAK